MFMGIRPFPSQTLLKEFAFSLFLLVGSFFANLHKISDGEFIPFQNIRMY